MHAYAIILFCVVQLSTSRRAHQYNITDTQLSFNETIVYQQDKLKNQFEINVANMTLMAGKQLFIVLESFSLDLVISLLNENKEAGEKASIIDMGTYSGNTLFVMNDSFHKGKLGFFKETGTLHFKILGQPSGLATEYNIHVLIGDSVDLSFGKIYSTRIDTTIKDLKVNLRYNGSLIIDLQKLRFQVTTIRQKNDYSLSVSLDHKGQYFQLNPVFYKTVGGILAKPNLPVCSEPECLYSLDISCQGIKSMNIESFLIPKIEILSINHYEEYYDRVYTNNQLTVYELPYEPSMEEMDITVSLIPVTGNTGLYVNAKTLPMNIEQYDWKETGALAKRITIRWKELEQMKASRSNLFIAVSTAKPGEFLLKIDAHDEGFKGRLHSGIVEQGYVAANDIVSYLYFFTVYETQDISFDVRLGVISGGGDLYIKKCINISDCKLDPVELSKEEILRAEGTSNPKVLTHSFTCEYQKPQLASLCHFVIGVRGQAGQGTHYEISLQERNFHRLMVPGHSLSLTLGPEETAYMKFSYPGTSKGTKLYLQAEGLWGSFDVIVSRSQQYPTQSPDNLQLGFVSTKLGLYDSMKTIPIDKGVFRESVQGIYYIAVKANSTCSLNIKFFEKGTEELSVHTLTAGSQARGEISRKKEVIYYTIKLASDKQTPSTAVIVLTPLKGEYFLFASRDGKLPTRERKELFSSTHQLELSYGDDVKHEEWIIGIQLSSQEDIKDDSYQFLLSLVIANKPLRINPGVITQHVISDANTFVAEVTNDMNSLLVIKSIVDGFNLKLCADFSSLEDKPEGRLCKFSAEDQSVALFFKKEELQANCGFGQAANARCFLQLSVTGNKNQKFSLGFTFNDHPFLLVKDLVVTGPSPQNDSTKLYFIYHAQADKTVGLYFNTKGQKLNIYTKLVRGDHFDDSDVLNFPTASSYDATNLEAHGYITNVHYEQSTVTNFGQQPEVLITIASQGKGEMPFNPLRSFVLVTSMDPHEILRTQAYTESVREDAWNYYNFYNNGNADSLRIYVSTATSARIEAMISKGLQARPPFTNKPLFQKVGLGSVDFDIKAEDLKLEASRASEQLKGYYTVGVKASSNCEVSIYWNNKSDLNFIEVTPNEPMTMQLEKARAFYFSFYARDIDTSAASDRGTIKVYVKTNVKSGIYLTKSATELVAPSASDYLWKSNTGDVGGITAITILPSDSNYCLDCQYIGYIEPSEDGQVTVLTNVRHSGLPIKLTPGFTFPDRLATDERVVYRVFNTDANQLDLSFTMLAGFVKIYISAQADVSEAKYDDQYSLETLLDIHKFISIYPSKYQVQGPHDFYVMVVNTRPEFAQYTFTVEKNGLRTPIEPGIQKFMHLAPGESSEYIYTPSESEALFEARLELEQVLDPKFIQAALDNIKLFMSLYHINENGDKFLIRYKSKSISENKVYIGFDISQNSKGTFIIHLYNPIASAVALTVDLLNGGYKLINLNDYSIDMIRKNEQVVYEGFGSKDKLLYVDFKVCYGDINLQVYQDDYDKLASANGTDYKSIKEKDTLTHYVRLEHERFFLRVANKNEELSIYEISVFNERDIENNAYSEISSGDGGRVSVDTERGFVLFQPIGLSSNYGNQFYHQVNYTVFLTDDFKVMRYAKNCGQFMINQAFASPYLQSFSFVVLFKSADEIRNYIVKQIAVPIGVLKPATKYYGAVVARINLLPAESGYISPVKTGKAYYDEFVFVTPRISIPINLLVSILICLSILVCLFCLVKSYIFGDVNKMKLFEKLEDLARFDEGVLGLNVIGILEKEYYADQRHETPAQKNPVEAPVKNEHNSENGKEERHEIEMTDTEKQKRPLDM